MVEAQAARRLVNNLRAQGFIFTAQELGRFRSQIGVVERFVPLCHGYADLRRYASCSVASLHSARTLRSSTRIALSVLPYNGSVGAPRLRRRLYTFGSGSSPGAPNRFRN
jgi:hypothetical protein